MLMSVFAQGKATRQLDHLVCIRGAVDSESIGMITFSVLHNKPALVGFEGNQVIVKPEEDGDAGLSFESLFDNCISIREYRLLQRANVTRVEDLPPALYEARIVVRINILPTVRVRLLASGEADVRRKLADLLNHDILFLEELSRQLGKQLAESSDVEAVTSGARRVDEVAPAGSPLWSIISDEDA
jgi:hypothetical protein